MADIRAAYEKLIARLLQGPGVTSVEQRRSAFDDRGVEPALASLLHKVAAAAHEVNDADIAAARGGGSSEEELFELMVCAAVGQASRQYTAALAALATASAEER